ncbi:hypothetical protein FB451DRAFT_1361373 [Mycena latifolia]|nr:hypothetical protein FB451DRAFT_1361373 [Mycena latifolia]
MLRYASLRIAFSLALLYVIHLKRPLTQLSQLEDVVQTTETIICDAKLHCPRDLVSLLEARVRLLNWKKYRLLSRDISDCVKKVKKIQNDVQIVVEAERQRKYTDDINETEIILASVRSPGVLAYQYVQRESAIMHYETAVTNGAHALSSGISGLLKTHSFRCCLGTDIRTLSYNFYPSLRLVSKGGALTSVQLLVKWPTENRRRLKFRQRFRSPFELCTAKTASGSFQSSGSAQATNAQSIVSVVKG